MQTVMDEKEQINGENQDMTKRRAKLELMIKDIQDELEGDKSARVSVRVGLAVLYYTSV